MKIIRSKVCCQRGKVKIQAIQYRPETNFAFPGVIILHGIEGFKAHHEEFGERIAKEGYVTLIPQWFGGETEGKNPDEVELNDIFSIVESLRSSKYVDKTRIGLIGFSLGAALALIFASSNKDIKALILYYPPADREKITQFFKKIRISSDFIKNILSPTLIIQGDNDRIVPIESACKLLQEFKCYNKLCEMRVYPDADHAFNWPDRGEYNAEAAEKAWRDMIEFLNRYLTPNPVDFPGR